MARRIDHGDSQCLSSLTVPVTGMPFTVSTWFKPLTQSDSPLGTLPLVTLYSSNFNTEKFQLYYYQNNLQPTPSGYRGLARCDSGGSQGIAITNQYNTNIAEWLHISAIFTNNFSRAVYLNGNGNSNSTTISTPSGINRLCIGQETIGSNSSLTLNTLISDLAIWDTALSSNEITQIAEGVSPLLIRPSSLVGYYPFVSRSGDYEFSLVDGPLLVNSGTTVENGNDFRLYKTSTPTVELKQSLAQKGIDLFLKCGETTTCFPYSSGVGGFTTGFDSGFTGGLLYGCPPGWHINFIVTGHDPYPIIPDSGRLDLYIQGHSPSSSGIDFFMPGLIADDIPYGYMYMYVRAPELSSLSSGLPLYMWATTNSGIRTGLDMFINANTSGISEGGINMYIHMDDGIYSTSYVNMFLKGIGNDDGSIGSYESIPLYLANNYVNATGYCDMYLAGPEGTQGAVPFSGVINLYLNRAYESIGHNIQFIIPGPSGISEGVNFFLEGQPNASSGIPLYTYGSETINSPVELYTSGY